MYYHRDKNIVFLANPRTASRAMAVGLTYYHGFELIGDHHSATKDDWIQTQPGAVVFSVARDVITTLISWSKLLGEPIEEMGIPMCCHTATGWPRWTLFPHTLVSTHVLPYENLQEALDDFLKDQGLDPFPIPRWDPHPDEPGHVSVNFDPVTKKWTPNLSIRWSDAKGGWVPAEEYDEAE